MKLIDSKYRLEQHSSGKDTCKIAIHVETNEILFVKFLRVTNNENESIEEQFNEFLGGNFLIAAGVKDFDTDIQFIGLRPAIVQYYHPKNWNNTSDLNVEVINHHEWPLFLALETLMHQTDRDPSKFEHIALPLVEGVGEKMKHRAVPIDMGGAFVGYPGGYQGNGKEINTDFVNRLFSSRGNYFTRDELTREVNRVVNLPWIEIIADSYKRYASFTNWTKPQLEYIANHTNRITELVYNIRRKLPDLLHAWFDQQQQAVQTQQPVILQAQQVI